MIAVATKATQAPIHAQRGPMIRAKARTGPVRVSGIVSGKHVSLTITTASGTQKEERDLDDVPVLGVNLPRRLAAQLGLQSQGRFIHGFRRTNIAVEVVEMLPSERADAMRASARAFPCGFVDGYSAARHSRVSW